jgi:hypothetical protein
VTAPQAEAGHGQLLSPGGRAGGAEMRGIAGIRLSTGKGSGAAEEQHEAGAEAEGKANAGMGSNGRGVGGGAER